MSASAEHGAGGFPIVVLASGRGSNLQALIAARDRGDLPIDIRAVLSDKPQCRALRRARDAGIAAIALDPRDYLDTRAVVEIGLERVGSTRTVMDDAGLDRSHSDRAAFDRALFARVAEVSPALIVLAGFMRILDPAVVGSFAGRMINIHPSLLPRYPGLHTHQRALDAGDALHGCSVHIVTPSLDAGPVIAQARLAIRSDDTAPSLAARLLPLEHRLLCATVALIASRRVQLGIDDWRYDGQRLLHPLQLGTDGELAPDEAR